MKTASFRNKKNPRIVSSAYIGLGDKMHNYTLVLINGGTEKMYCTQEQIRLRIHDESKPRVQYIDFKQR